MCAARRRRRRLRGSSSAAAAGRGPTAGAWPPLHWRSPVDPLTVSTVVTAPRERVFDYLQDIANHGEFTDHYLVDWHLTRIDSVGRGAGASAPHRRGGPRGQEQPRSPRGRVRALPGPLGHDPRSLHGGDPAVHAV